MKLNANLKVLMMLFAATMLLSGAVSRWIESSAKLAPQTMLSKFHTYKNKNDEMYVYIVFFTIFKDMTPLFCLHFGDFGIWIMVQDHMVLDH